VSEIYKLGPKKIQLEQAQSREASTDAKAEWKVESRPGGVLIATHLKTGKRKRFWTFEKQGHLSLQSEGRLFYGKLEAKVRGGSAQAGSDADLVAQFPGKVRKVLVKVGQKVQEGDSLLLVEAMKMEFTIRAPYSGEITKMNVQDGQQLSPGVRFLDLKAAT
jgi:biotin carboxyl carrier protein